MSSDVESPTSISSDYSNTDSYSEHWNYSTTSLSLNRGELESGKGSKSKKQVSLLTFNLLLVCSLLFAFLFFVFVLILRPALFFLTTQPIPTKTTKWKRWIQNSEMHDAEVILMHVPTVESFFGGLHPSGALFGGGFNLTNTQKQILHFQSLLKSMGIQVINIREVLMKCDREELIQLASKYLQYSLDNTQCEQIDIDKGDCSKAQEYYLSEEYKRDSLGYMASKNLVDVLLLQPIITLKKNDRNTNIVTLSTSVNPVFNLLFSRDQQIITKRGIVMGRMNSFQRQLETDILELVWEKVGGEDLVVGRIPPSNTEFNYFLEGGDYIPLNDRIGLIGVGLRTTMDAAMYLIENDLIGTEEVGIVVDEKDFDQDRMHLDTVMNIVDDDVVVLLEPIYKSTDPEDRFYRRVDIFKRVVTLNSEIRKEEYKFERSMSLREYLEDRNGYKVIPISKPDQENFLINFLNLGRNRGIATVRKNLKEIVDKFYEVNFQDRTPPTFHVVPYGDVLKLYGGLHCTSQVGRSMLRTR